MLGAEHRDELDVFADDALQHPARPVDHRVEIDGTGAQHLLPTVGEKLVVSSAERCALDTGRRLQLG